jgi:hypothetical protein
MIKKTRLIVISENGFLLPYLIISSTKKILLTLVKLNQQA